jgi:DNA-binding transcriptional MerR regulator
VTVLRIRTEFVGDEHATDPAVASTADIVYAAGITFRQLDYWTRVGYIHPLPRRAETAGQRRFFPRSELAFACLLGRLDGAGVAPQQAHDHARELLDTGTTTLAGITIHLPEEL